MSATFHDALTMLEAHISSTHDKTALKALNTIRTALLSRWAKEEPADFAYFRLASGQSINSSPEDRLDTYWQIADYLRGLN